MPKNSFVEGLAGNATWAALVVVWGIVGGSLTGLGTWLLTRVGVATPIAVAAAFSVAPVISMIAFYIVIKKYFSHRMHFPYSKQYFRVRRAYISYEVKDNVIEYKKEKDLTSLRDDVGYYEDVYRWTGREMPIPVSGDRNHTVELDDVFAIWQSYHIKFNHRLKKGEEENTTVKWAIPNQNDSAPFFSTTIEEPTDKLVLRFKPKAGTVGKVYLETKFSLSAKNSFETEIIEATADGEYVREFKPKMYYYYEVHWNRLD